MNKKNFSKNPEGNSVLERIIPGSPGQHNLYQEHLARYRFAQKYILGKKILDAGCGCGYGSFYLAKEGAREVIGIDISQEAVSYAKNHYQASNLFFEKMDCAKLSFAQETFDCVVSYEVIEHLENPELFLKGAKRILKRGGVLVISTPNKKQGLLASNPYHINEYTFLEFNSLLTNYFRKIDFYGQRYKKSSLLKANKKKNKLTFISKPLIQFMPQRFKNFLYLKFIDRFFQTRVEDFPIEKNRINNASVILGVCWK